MKAIYKFEFDCGRQGTLYGTFVEEKEKVDALVKSGTEIEFGEVLGKHSDITGPVEEKDIVFVTDDVAFIELFEKFDLSNGFNPFDYIPEPEGKLNLLMKKQLVVGCTGGIGSGKTTVCKLFNELGVPTYDADAAAKRIMKEEHIVTCVKLAFKDDDVMDGKTLDRKKLAKIVFNDKGKLKMLEAIVYPFIWIDFAEWKLKQNASYVIMENAVLFESGAAVRMDYIITVMAPEEDRIERTIKRDSCTKEEALARMKNQLSDKDRMAMSQFGIDNDTSRQFGDVQFNYVKDQVEKTHRKILNTLKL